jgi:hypothetical protein
MPRLKPAKELESLITSLAQERREHEQAIAQIDAVFARYGIAVAGGRGRGRRGAGVRGLVARAGKKAGGRRRKRGRFTLTAEESILRFLKSANKPSTADVNVHWKSEGRGGKADNTLTRMVKEGKLKRVKSKDVRGSRYSAA